MKILKKLASALGGKEQVKAKSPSTQKSRPVRASKKSEQTKAQYEWRPGQSNKPQSGGSKKRSGGAKKPRADQEQGERKPHKEGSRSGKRKRAPHKLRSEQPQPPRSKQSTAPKRPPVDESPWELSEFQVEPQEGKVRFHDLDLHPKLMRSIQALGWEYATPIQGEILPGTLKGKDMAGRAQTGTGKTAAFLISIINHRLNKSLPKHSMGCPAGADYCADA